MSSAMGTLRTPESEARYKVVVASPDFKKSCPLCEKPVTRTFTHWKLIKNEYPYDRIAEVHDMIVSKRHVTEHELTQEEWKEFQDIKHSYIQDTYEWIFEPTHHKKS